MIIRQHAGPVSGKDSMTSEQKDSFSSGYRIVDLPIGFELWRFVSRKEDNRFGAFWISCDTMQNIMQTLHANNNFSQVYIKENLRNSLAILNEWSNVNWRLKIRLSKEVIAYAGATASQKQFKMETNNSSFGGGKMLKVTETRIGRMEQYIIPGFRNLSDNNSFAKIEVFVHI